MDFIWDSANINHIAKHNVIPEEVEEAFDNGIFEVTQQFRNGEHRTVHLGESSSGRVWFIIATRRADAFRIVMSRDANRKERGLFTALKEQQNGAIH